MRISIDSNELKEAIVMYLDYKADIPREQIGDITIETTEMTSFRIDDVLAVSFEKGE